MAWWFRRKREGAKAAGFGGARRCTNRGAARGGFKDKSCHAARWGCSSRTRRASSCTVSTFSYSRAGSLCTAEGDITEARTPPGVGGSRATRGLPSSEADTVGHPTPMRTPSGHVGKAASGRKELEGDRCSGGVTVPALSRAGGTNKRILAGGVAFPNAGGARATLQVLTTVGAGAIGQSLLLLLMCCSDWEGPRFGLLGPRVLGRPRAAVGARRQQNAVMQSRVNWDDGSSPQSIDEFSPYSARRRPLFRPRSVSPRRRRPCPTPKGLPRLRG